MFRLLLTGAGEGAYNMGIDYAILQCFKAGSVPPTIRFFWFDPPCVSIGKLQTLLTLNNMGYYLVRRPTGGRAVVHKDDLSYSIICKRDHPLLGGRVLDTYLSSSRILVNAARLLGIPAEIVQTKSGNTRADLCFQSKGRYEIVSNQRKIIGSAQKREGDFILLQGSIFLDIEKEKIISKYKLILDSMGIDYKIDSLTEKEKNLARLYAPEFRK